MRYLLLITLALFLMVEVLVVCEGAESEERKFELCKSSWTGEFNCLESLGKYYWGAGECTELKYRHQYWGETEGEKEVPCRDGNLFETEMDCKLTCVG